MCGICGIWLREGGIALPELVAMRDSIAHRGPDGASGVLLSTDGASPFVFGAEPQSVDRRYDVGFGHRRLAIIDLVSGDQPMATPDGATWLVYNGELYNYRELRDALRARGRDFRTESDTEVVLQAYAEFGEDCVDHLNGIFAFAIWDGRARRLFLARDHLGVKPLYFAETAEGFAFASEAKALFASGLLRAEVDVEVLGATLTFRHTPSPRTLFRGVRKLPPGSSLTVVGARGGDVRLFGDTVAPSRGEPESTWVAALATEIGESVRRQMVSDVPIGLSLSSGVDSSTLLAVMSRASSEPVNAFTIGFDGRGGGDELGVARETATRYGASFTERVLSRDDYGELMARYLWHLEEPLGNESAPAYYFVAEMAREAGVKVLLTGQGPDELFAGYDRHVGIAFRRLLVPAASPVVRSVVRRVGAGRPLREKYERLVGSTGYAELDRVLLATYSSFARTELEALLAPDVAAGVDWELPLATVRSWLARAPHGTPLERMLWVDTRTFLPDNLLLAEDKLAMAASVEARVPFLDRRFVALAEQVPGDLKLRIGRRKHLFRRACATWIGGPASRRRKIGFANPMAEWLRSDLIDGLFPAVDDPASFVGSYLRPARVRELLDEHRRGSRDHSRKLFLIASIESWYGTFVG